MHFCMDWKSVSFDWNQVRGFYVTAEEGSLSAAARALGLTQPTLGRQVAALEEELGVVLFDRIGRGLKLTQAGQELMEQVGVMVEAANRVSLIASGRAEALEGQVRITASDILSAYILPPAIAEIRQAAPGIDIDVVAVNDIRNLLRREADIAIRHVRPQQTDLIARLVQESTGSFYAARSYLDKRGTPQSVEDLSNHDFIGYGDHKRMLEYLNPLGYSLTEDNFRLGSQNGIVAWQLVRRGLGISVMSDEVVAAFPEIVRVLPDMDPLVFPIWLVTHRELHTSRRIRLVYDLLAEFLTK